MADIIVTTKTDLEAIVENSVRKVLQSQSITTAEPKENYFSVEQAAEYLQLAEQTLYGFTSKRKIPFIKKGKKLYFKESELKKWLETGNKKSKSQIEKELEDK
jgi:excisionase family DNA binding protein